MKQTVNWHDFWSRSVNPGFHEARVNSHLNEFLSHFNLNPGDTVFLPLCGKAVDMLWLASQGLNVIGVELSEVAVRAFFEESDMPYTVEDSGNFTVYQAERIRLYHGNFIHLQPQDLENCKLVYDRAALVAIEPHNREVYAQHMLRITPDATPMLVVALEYDQSAMQGPPFSVPSDEVESLYSEYYTMQILYTQEKIEDEPHWRERGLESFMESALRLDAK